MEVPERYFWARRQLFASVRCEQINEILMGFSNGLPGLSLFNIYESPHFLIFFQLQPPGEKVVFHPCLLPISQLIQCSLPDEEGETPSGFSGHRDTMSNGLRQYRKDCPRVVMKPDSYPRKFRPNVRIHVHTEGRQYIEHRDGRPSISMEWCFPLTDH